MEFDLVGKPTAEALAAALNEVLTPENVPGGANVVIGLGPRAFEALGAKAPADYVPFEKIVGADGREAAATQHDVWVWIQWTEEGRLWEAAQATAKALVDIATLQFEVSTFEYADGRDLTGFKDGTENPGGDLRLTSAVVQEGPHAGGSYVIVQKWVHNLPAFEALPLKDQEDVFGRSKQDDVEQADDVKPPTAHNARNVVHDDAGNELKIWRRNSRFGGVAENGAMFVGFACEPTRMDRMLSRMFNASGDGLHDRFTDFSSAVTGARYFTPSVEALSSLLASAAMNG
jgi:porphyrinogen peroxidase